MVDGSVFCGGWYSTLMAPSDLVIDGTVPLCCLVVDDTYSTAVVLNGPVVDGTVPQLC
jgi:hypothetical protein